MIAVPAISALRDLYANNVGRFTQFVHSFPDEDLPGPLLIEPTAYFEQPRRLLVVGQETGGWGYYYDDVDAQLAVYKKFNLGEKWPGPFWNITRKVESILGIERCSCAWSNLNRFDHDGHAPIGKILDELSKLDFLVREEIRILRPDICLFYTNRKYDHRLKALYPGAQFNDVEGLPGSHFARLTHTDLPKLTFRTPHPRSMRMQGNEKAFLTFMGNLFGQRQPV